MRKRERERENPEPELHTYEMLKAPLSPQLRFLPFVTGHFLIVLRIHDRNVARNVRQSKTAFERNTLDDYLFVRNLRQNPQLKI